MEKRAIFFFSFQISPSNVIAAKTPPNVPGKSCLKLADGILFEVDKYRLTDGEKLSKKIKGKGF